MNFPSHLSSTLPPCPPDPEPAGRLSDAIGLPHLREAAAGRRDWLWHGLLAPGSLTLLSGPWRCGKTTLLAVLLARLKHGGSFLGRPLRPGKALVVSEDGEADWCRRADRLDLDGHVGWLCRPFEGRPRPGQWQDLLDHLADLHARHPFQLVAIDSLTPFLSAREANSVRVLREHLRPVRRLAGLGPSVLLTRHSPHSESAAGRARGPGALAGCLDILIEMRSHGPFDPADRRRVLHTWSRYEERPRPLLIELNAAGTDYEVLGDPEEEGFRQNWRVLQMVLAEATAKLTRAEVLRAWPKGAEAPNEVTLWRWLGRAMRLGLVCREGKGRRADPFRYWLASREGD